MFPYADPPELHQPGMRMKLTATLSKYVRHQLFRGQALQLSHVVGAAPEVERFRVDTLD
jgi:hypothetical protein